MQGESDSAFRFHSISVKENTGRSLSSGKRGSSEAKLKSWQIIQSILTLEPSKQSVYSTLFNI